MADLNQLKQKYAPVIDEIQSFGDLGAKVEDVSLNGEKLHLKANLPSQVVANRVWDEIKRVDPAYSDLDHELVTSGGANQSYTIKSGDNLSSISKRFYGNANQYSKIASASGIPDPDKIRAGQQITIPA